MYAFIKGEDGHFCFKIVKSKSEGNRWLKNEQMLYGICYTHPVCGVVTNTKFFELFPQADAHSIMQKRYGARLKKELNERKIFLRDKNL